MSYHREDGTPTIQASIPSASKFNSNLKKITLCPQSDLVPAKLINIGLLNCRSVVYKTLAIKDHIVDNDCDLFAITESWLSPSSHPPLNSGAILPGKCCRDKHVIKSLVPSGYKFLHIPRDRKGGGVALIYKEGIDIKPQECRIYSTFEYMECLLKSNSRWVRLLILYRPPPSKENRLTYKAFISEFTCILEILSLSVGELCIIGDFNLHVDNLKDSSAAKFLNLLEVFGLQQNVSKPTHKHGHTLDLVITRLSESLISDMNVLNPMISDHHTVLFKLMIDKPKFRKERIFFRSWKKIDRTAFSNDLSNMIDLSKPNALHIDENVSLYNTKLGLLVDKHAPLKDKNITIRPNAPWYNKDINTAKRYRRKLEHKWLKTGKESNKLDFKNQCKLVSEMVFNSKKLFYN